MRWTLALLLPLALGSAALGAGTAPRLSRQKLPSIWHPRPAPPKVFSVTIPRGIPLEKLVGAYSASFGGLYSVQPLRFAPATRTARVDVTGAKWLKLFLYCPGYRAVADTWTGQEIASVPYKPRFVPAGAVTVRGVMTDSEGGHINGGVLMVRYPLKALRRFFRASCTCPTLNLASTATDEEGRFALSVPDLYRDPFFRLYGWSERFVLSQGDHPAPTHDPNLVPNDFPVQKTYPELLRVTRLENGQINGHLYPAFFSSHSLMDMRPGSEGAKRLSLFATTRVEQEDVSYPVTVGPDGRFGADLPPGRYELRLTVSPLRPGGMVRRYLLLRDIPVQEGLIKTVHVE